MVSYGTAFASAKPLYPDLSKISSSPLEIKFKDNKRGGTAQRKIVGYLHKMCCTNAQKKCVVGAVFVLQTRVYFSMVLT